jgi:hypothetical protein
MQRILNTALVASVLSLSAIPVARVWAGDGGGFVAGAVGGLAAGTLLGIAASGPHYAPPPPVYPAYGPECYWTRGGQPYWDGYRGAWVYPRVQVCQ